MASSTKTHDVLIILPLEEEYDAFCRTLTTLSLQFQKISQATFATEFTVSALGGAHLRCVVASISKSEVHNSTVETQKLIELFCPKHVIICGIAMTGLSHDALPGHVTIASKVFSLHNRKDNTYQLDTIEPYPKKIAERFYSHSGSESFKRRIRMLQQEQTVDDRFPHKCLVHFRPVLCGDELISGDANREQFVHSNHNLRDTAAYDMESHYILRGCSYPKKVPGIVIRGLSDDGANKSTLPQSLRSKVVSYCACLVIDGLQHGILYGRTAPPKRPPYQHTLTILTSQQTSQPFDGLAEAIDSLGVSCNVLNTSESYDEFCFLGERSKAVLICLDENLASSGFFASLFNQELEDDADQWSSRLKKSNTRLFILLPSRFQISAIPWLPAPPVHQVDDEKSLKLAFREILLSINYSQTQTGLDELQDGFLVSPDRASVLLNCDGKLRSFRWNTREEKARTVEHLESLSAGESTQALACTERLYRVFRDVQQCLLHAELNIMNHNTPSEQVDRIGNEHLRHAQGILETRGKISIVAYNECFSSFEVPANASVHWQEQTEVMLQVYNSTYSCVQSVIARWENDSALDYDRVSDLCVMVEGACHWLLNQQREL